MAVNAGVAYIDVVPRTAGLGTKLTKDVETAGATAGTAGGTAISKGVVKETEGLGSKLKGQFASFAPLLGVALGGALLKGSLDAFARVEDAEKRLELGLEAIHQPQALDDLTGWASDFADKTGILQADVEDFSGKLLNMGAGFFEKAGPQGIQVLEDMTTALEGMSIETGKSATMLMRSLGPAILNVPDKAIPLLQKYGALTDDQVAAVTRLTDAGDKQAASQLIINDLMGKFGDAAAKARTPQKQLAEELNKLELVIGQGLIPVIQIVTDILGPLLSVFSSLPGPVKDAAVAFGLLWGATKLFGGSLGGLFGAIKRFGLFIAGMIGDLGALATTNLTAATTFDGLAGSETAAGTAAQGASAGFVALAGSVAAVAAPIAAFVLAQQAVKEVAEKTTAVLKAGGQALDDWAKKINHAQNVTHSIFGVLAEFVPGFRDIKDGIDESADAIDHRLITALHNSFDPLAGLADRFKAAATEAHALANTQVAQALSAAGRVLGRLNDVLGFSIDKTKSAKDNLVAYKQAVVDWRTSTADQLNFVSSAFGALATKQGQTVARLEAGLDKNLAKMKEFGDNLATIARDGGRGAQELVQQLLALGPAGASMAQKLVDAGKTGRAGIERDLGHAFSQSMSEAGQLGKAMRVMGHEIARSIIIATTPLAELGAKLAALDNKHYEPTVGVDTSQANAELAAFVSRWNNIHLTLNMNADTSLHGRAGGGPIQPLTPYIVGEHGPELFMSDRAGRIEPRVPTMAARDQWRYGNSVRLAVEVNFDRRRLLDKQDYELKFGGPA